MKVGDEVKDAIVNKIDGMVGKINSLIDSLDRRGMISGIGNLELAVEALQSAMEDLESDFDSENDLE